MKTFPISLAAGVAATALTFAATAWAEHGDAHNGCMDFNSTGSSSSTETSPFALPDLAGALDDALAFINSTEGKLTKNETTVHYNMLVDLDLQSLEEGSLVLVSCRVGILGNNNFPGHGQNSRLISGAAINNTPTTVEIPICISRVSDPRLATHWRCELNLTTYSVLETANYTADDYIKLHTVIGSDFPELVPAAGTAPVKKIEGPLLFAADTQLVFESGQ